MAAPVVLLHGFATSTERTWREPGWFDLLKDARRRAIGIDLLGHGDAPKPTDAAPYSTYYQFLVDTQGRRLLRESYGQQLLFVVEAAEAVPWTKPADVVYERDKPLPPLGGIFEDGFNASYADGAVLFFSRKLREERLRELIEPE